MRRDRCKAVRVSTLATVDTIDDGNSNLNFDPCIFMARSSNEDIHARHLISKNGSVPELIRQCLHLAYPAQ